MTIALCIAAYIASFAFTFCWCSRDWAHEFGSLTRGDLAFFAFIAIIPGIGVLLWATAATRGFWSKRVWPK